MTLFGEEIKSWFVSSVFRSGDYYINAWKLLDLKCNFGALIFWNKHYKNWKALQIGKTVREAGKTINLSAYSRELIEQSKCFECYAHIFLSRMNQIRLWEKFFRKTITPLTFNCIGTMKLCNKATRLMCFTILCVCIYLSRLQYPEISGLVGIPYKCTFLMRINMFEIRAE